ncbi:MAG: purine-nucleoside phosphorylase [Lachnospiraceae bacterium]|nr:purine-nucleoside phosphorylase [Lachnospiraceae bacterium]
MSEVYDKLLACYESCRKRTDFQPKVALILGSGLGALADEIDIVTTIPYSEIEGFPQSTVAGHKGRFVFGYIGQVPVVIMQGRVHYYEGYPMTDVVLPTRLMGMLGAKILFLTNAAGGINAGFKPGTLMLIRDQISTFVPSPLLGKNIDELGARFPDMSEIYRKDLQEILEKKAEELQIPLEKGVYIQFTGPAYESPAEVKMAGLLGADACGMSTACEAIVANHMGMRVCGISCITNMASGITGEPLSHQEVQETADRVAKQFKQLVKAGIEAFADI